MGKIRLCIKQSTGSYLKGSNVKHISHPSINILTDDNKPILEIDLTFNQLAQFLCSQMAVDCTINRIFIENGEKDKIEPVKSLQQRASEAFGEIHSDLTDRIQSLHDRVYDLLNSGKAGKNELKDVLHDIRVVRDNYASNHGFMLSQSQEDVENMRDDMIAEIDDMIAEIATVFNNQILNAEPVKLIKSTLDKENSNPTLDKENSNPVGETEIISARPRPIPIEIEKSNYQKIVKEPEDMTNLELADNIHKELRRIENNFCKNEKVKGAHLFGSGAFEAKGGVSIRYISYQGSHTVEKEKAIRYLKFLRTVNSAKSFKTDYWFEKNKGE